MKFFADALKKKKKDLIKIISSPNNKISKGEFIKLNRSYSKLNETYINILKKSPHFNPQVFNKLKMGGKKTKKRGKTKRGKTKRGKTKRGKIKRGKIKRGKTKRGKTKRGKKQKKK